mgnify:FL=1
MHYGAGDFLATADFPDGHSFGVLLRICFPSGSCFLFGWLHSNFRLESHPLKQFRGGFLSITIFPIVSFQHSLWLLWFGVWISHLLLPCWAGRFIFAWIFHFTARNFFHQNCFGPWLISLLTGFRGIARRSGSRTWRELAFYLPGGISKRSNCYCESVGWRTRWHW